LADVFKYYTRIPLNTRKQVTVTHSWPLFRGRWSVLVSIAIKLRIYTDVQHATDGPYSCTQKHTWCSLKQKEALSLMTVHNR